MRCGRDGRTPETLTESPEDLIISKAAFIILAAGAHESLGRAVHAFMGAREYAKESGGETRIIFDGAGTQAAAEFSKKDHKYNEPFEKCAARSRGRAAIAPARSK